MRNHIPGIVTIAMLDDDRSIDEGLVIVDKLDTPGTKRLKKHATWPRQRQLNIVIAEQQHQLAARGSEMPKAVPYVGRSLYDPFELLAGELVLASKRDEYFFSEEIDDVPGQHERYITIRRSLFCGIVNEVG